MSTIRKVAVIGAGTMGAGIAAQVANAGIPVLLLDMVPDGARNRNAIAEGAVARSVASALMTVGSIPVRSATASGVNGCTARRTSSIPLSHASKRPGRTNPVSKTTLAMAASRNASPPGRIGMC